MVTLNSVCLANRGFCGFIDQGLEYLKKWCFEMGLMISSHSCSDEFFPDFSSARMSLSWVYLSRRGKFSDLWVPAHLVAFFTSVSLFTLILIDGLHDQCHCGHGVSCSYSHVLCWEEARWFLKPRIQPTQAWVKVWWHMLIFGTCTGKQERRYLRMEGSE